MGWSFFRPALKAKRQQCEMSQADVESLEGRLILKESRRLTLDSICHVSTVRDISGPDSENLQVFQMPSK